MKSAVFLASILLTTASLRAEAPALRIAVIGDADEEDLAALITSELSSNQDISLVERDDLAKVGDELALQQLAGSDPVALGKLLGADGLLFLDKKLDESQVRFTAVNLGYALFDDPVPAGMDPTREAKVISHLVFDNATKLKLDPAKAIPISVLNLRSEYALGDYAVLERKLTLLLESRLSSLPNYVVLERRHAWSLGFERALSVNSKPLLRGAYLIDGAISFPPQPQRPGYLTIQLRLRSPTNQETTLEVHGTIGDLNGLVERMTAEIRKAAGDTDPTLVWDSQKEAREYLLEGLWCYYHDSPDAALEALDSAELLGEKATDLVAIRSNILFNRADVAFGLATKNDSDSRQADPSLLDSAVDKTLRAIAETARYDSGNMEAKLQFLTYQEHPEVRADEIKQDLSNFASKLLGYLDDRRSPRADELRLAIRAITGYDPLHGKLGRADLSNPLNVLTDLPEDWNFTLEEELAAIHLAATKPYQFRPSLSIDNHGAGFCGRFLKTPEEQERVFDRFVQDLKIDPDGQLTYLLMLSCSTNAGVADPAYTAYWQEMWKHREELVSQKVQVEEWTSSRGVPFERRQKHAKEMLPLLHYYLTHVNNYRYWEYSWDVMWQPDQWSEADAAAIWKDFLAFRQRADADHRARGDGPLGLSEVEEPFLKKFPQIAQMKAPVPAPNPLIVNRLWHPWLIPGVLQRPMMDICDCRETDDALWVAVRFYYQGQSALFKVSLPGFETERIELPVPDIPGEVVTTPKAIYVRFDLIDAPTSQRLARFDLKTRTWETRTFDFSFGHFYAVNGSLYFDLQGGIGRYDWDTAKFTLLASSRRKPAHNQFDDCEGYGISGIYAGPGGRPCATIRGGTYYVQEERGNWPEVFDSTWASFCVTNQNRTLIYSQYNGEVILLDPALSAPEYLMAPAWPHLRKGATIDHPSISEMTPWRSQAVWDAADGLYSPSCFGGDSQHLFQILTPDDGRKSYELLWYDRKHGRQPRLIPLQFVLDEKNRAVIARTRVGWNEPKPLLDNLNELRAQEKLRVLATKDAICLLSGDLGIWFLYYDDIETYLKTHPTDEPGLMPSIAQTIKIPSPEDDAQSQVCGYMIDPVIRCDCYR
jgi:hypothetical protein